MRASHTHLDEGITQSHLVEGIIETFVQVLQVQQDDSLPSLHAHLDAVDVPTNLKGGKNTY